MAFLEVLTRCHPQRPAMLERNQASLKLQTFYDWEQVLLKDDVGRGVAWANENLSMYRTDADYVWVLDDDDECVRPSLFRELHQIAELDEPDVIFIKMDLRERHGVLPRRPLWGGEPIAAEIASSCIVTSGDVWNRHAGAWNTGGLMGDWGFIHSVWQDDVKVFWHDAVGARSQSANGASFGAAE